MTTESRTPPDASAGAHDPASDDHAPDDPADDSAALPGPSDRRTGAVLLVGGLVGAFFAVVLLLEKLALLLNPAYVPSCSIDPVLSCGTIMRTAQASAFGFPNPIIGVASFPVLAAVGALLLSGVALPRWTWLATQFATMLALGFVLWLIGESLLVIHALCPYCMVVWVVVITVCWAVVVRNTAAGEMGGGARRPLFLHRASPGSGTEEDTGWIGDSAAGAHGTELFERWQRSVWVHSAD